MEKPEKGKHPKEKNKQREEGEGYSFIALVIEETLKSIYLLPFFEWVDSSLL